MLISKRTASADRGWFGSEVGGPFPKAEKKSAKARGRKSGETRRSISGASRLAKAG